MRAIRCRRMEQAWWTQWQLAPHMQRNKLPDMHTLIGEKAVGHTSTADDLRKTKDWLNALNAQAKEPHGESR